MLGIGNDLVSQSYLQPSFSLSFDGTNDSLTLGNVLNLGTADFSFSFWINLPDITNKYLITKREDDDNTIFHYFSSEKIVMLEIADGNTVCNHSGGSNMTTLQNTWVHVCQTADRDGNTAIYINGSASNPGLALHDMSYDTQDLDNTGSWTFMRYSSNYTQGLMTDVAIYNVALSATHVGEIYNGGSPFDLTTHSQGSALTGYWRFNEGTGTSIADEIGSNDLTIVGATWSTNTPS